MTHNPAKSTKGFSLIEVLAYLSIFMIISVGSVMMLMTLQQNVYEYRANQALTRNSTNIMERMMLDVRSTDTISAGTFGSSPGNVTLVSGATTTAYSLSGGNIMVSVNGGAAAALTGTPVSVTSLRFDQFDNGISIALRITATLQATVGTAVVTETYTNTAVLLNSYD